MLYTIRPAEEKDLSAVYHFICLLEEINFDYSLFASIYKDNLQNKYCVYLVAVSGTEDVIGFISSHLQNLLHHCGKVAEIQELYVDKNYRNMAIGKKLVEALEKSLKQKNCVSFEVTAQNKREQTHRFYESAGFTCSHKKFVKQLV